MASLPIAVYSTVEFIELTSAVPFTLAQLKEFTLARGFIPSLHGATTLPVFSHPPGGDQPCPLALSRVLAVLVSQLTSSAARCLQSFQAVACYHGVCAQYNVWRVGWRAAAAAAVAAAAAAAAERMA